MRQAILLSLRPRIRSISIKNAFKQPSRSPPKLKSANISEQKTLLHAWQLCRSIAIQKVQHAGVESAKKRREESRARETRANCKIAMQTEAPNVSGVAAGGAPFFLVSVLAVCNQRVCSCCQRRRRRHRVSRSRDCRRGRRPTPSDSTPPDGGRRRQGV